MKPSDLTPEQRERYEERAAIREYEGNQTRANAEAAAMIEVVKADTPPGVSPQKEKMMKETLFGMAAACWLIAGCGFGPADLVRDVLVLFATQVGHESVSDGLDCWDFDADRMCDEWDDWNGPDGEPDGMCDAWDCQGVAGKDGIDGEQGRRGEDGLLGPQGETGADGLDGTDGVDGADGHEGAEGDDGVDGIDGTDGVDGIDGTDEVDGTVHCPIPVVCHNGMSLRVDASAIPAHLRHGDKCGRCPVEAIDPRYP